MSFRPKLIETTFFTELFPAEKDMQIEGFFFSLYG